MFSLHEIMSTNLQNIADGRGRRQRHCRSPQRLKANDSPITPKRALWKLRELERHETLINHVPFNDISSATPEQLKLYRHLGISRFTSSETQTA